MVEIIAVRAQPTFVIKLKAEEARRLWDTSYGLHNLRNEIKRVYEREVGPSVDL